MNSNDKSSNEQLHPNYTQAIGNTRLPGPTCPGGLTPELWTPAQREWVAKYGQGNGWFGRERGAVTKREASRETLERLAEAVDAGFESAAAHHYEAVKSALLAYRAEITPPLRTQADVDAEIVRLVRSCGSSGGPGEAPQLSVPASVRERLAKLRDEPTRSGAPRQETIGDWNAQGERDA